jgi:hypothetical protein
MELISLKLPLRLSGTRAVAASVVVDTGTIVAFLAADDQYHDWVKAEFARLRRRELEIHAGRERSAENELCQLPAALGTAKFEVCPPNDQAPSEGSREMP